MTVVRMACPGGGILAQCTTCTSVLSSPSLIGGKVLCAMSLSIEVTKRTDPELEEVPCPLAPPTHVACLTSALSSAILVLQREVGFFPTAAAHQHGDGRCGRESRWQWAPQVGPGGSGPGRVSHGIWGSPLLCAGGLKAFSSVCPPFRGPTAIPTEDLPATVLTVAQRLKGPLARLFRQVGPVGTRGPRPRPAHTRPPGAGPLRGRPGGPVLRRERQSPRART